MSGCPLWRPDCAAIAVGGGVIDTVSTVVDVGETAVDAVRGAASVAGSLGGLLPLLLLALLALALWKLLGFGRQVSLAVADGYTGGKATRAKNFKETLTDQAKDRGRDARRSRETSKGPQVSTHTGTGVEIVERHNDQLGRPARVVVCAPSPGDASTALATRMHGHQMTPAGSKPCDLKAAGHRHFTFKRT